MKHYVYRHIRLDTNTPFYVGKGVGSRANRMSIRNKYHKNIVKKHGVRVEIVKYFKTNEEALNFEKILINAYLKVGIKLANMTLGGEGLIFKRKPLSENVKVKISEKLKGRKIPKERSKRGGDSRRGIKNPMFRGYYITPFGTFSSSVQASEAIGIKADTISYRCKKSVRYKDWKFQPC